MPEPFFKILAHKENAPWATRFFVRCHLWERSMLISEETRFVQIVAYVESNANPEAWGDHGHAVGRFQDHARYYDKWGPKGEDFGGVEQTWNWCFEFACRKFFRAARAKWPHFSLLQIGMYRHLHGQLDCSGWDLAYEKRWLEVENAIPAL